MSPTLADLYHKLAPFAGLKESVTLPNVDYFIRLGAHFIQEIKLHTPHNCTEPPFRLPTYLHELFCLCLDLDDLTVIQLWGAFKMDIWNAEGSLSNRLSKAEHHNVDTYGMRPSPYNEKLGECFQCYLSRKTYLGLKYTSLNHVLSTSDDMCHLRLCVASEHFITS